jgi:predicted transcriptional regulator
MTTKSKLENLTIRLEAETREAFERLAEREDRPLAYLIRRALRAEAAKREAQGSAVA